MKFLKKIGLLLSIAFFIFGCSDTVSTSKEYRVGRVIDGDTIELVNGQMVRYLGIDTPEIRKRQGNTWVYAPEPYAEKAKEFNRILVEGKDVRLEFDIQKKDTYGRLLAYCFLGDTFVNAKILEEGLGLLYTLSPNVSYVDVLVKKQQEARQNNRGIWGEPFVILPQQAKEYLDKIATVEGEVSSVFQSPKVAILNFGRSKFKGVIFKEEFPFFMVNGISILKTYKGKTLRITGKLKKYQDAVEIIVRHPSAIEIMD